MPKCDRCKGRISLSKSSTKKNPNRLYFSRTCCGGARKSFVSWADECPHEQYEACHAINKHHKVKSVNVDAFDPETNTCYLFQGCRWHGCDKCSAGCGLPNHMELLETTNANVQMLTDTGYNVVSRAVGMRGQNPKGISDNPCASQRWSPRWAH